MILTDDKGNKFEFDWHEGESIKGKVSYEGTLKPLEWPQEEEYYYYFDEYGDVSTKSWLATPGDMSRSRFGNCFRTEKEAEIARDKIKALLQGLK